MKKFLRLSNLLLGLIVAGLLVWRITGGKKPPAGAEYGKVAAFSFVDQTGKSFGSTDLSGKPWVADFVFTRCMGPCPLLTTRMAELQKKFQDNKRLVFVSFSVDPDYDTPEKLAAYGKIYGVDEARWHLLTGPRQKVYDLIRGSFHLAVEPEKGQTLSETAVLHSVYFALIDGNGVIRGYFDSGNPDSMKSLQDQIRSL